jgi:hypothetical protein
VQEIGSPSSPNTMREFLGHSRFSTSLLADDLSSLKKFSIASISSCFLISSLFGFKFWQQIGSLLFSLQYAFFYNRIFKGEEKVPKKFSYKAEFSCREQKKTFSNLAHNISYSLYEHSSGAFCPPLNQSTLTLSDNEMIRRIA